VGVNLRWLAVAVRASAGIDLQLSHLHLSVDLGGEYFFIRPADQAVASKPLALPLSLGVGWSF
jgi:hypothetical protein